jgi:hypothetical protein
MRVLGVSGGPSPAVAASGRFARFALFVVLPTRFGVAAGLQSPAKPGDRLARCAADEEIHCERCFGKPVWVALKKRAAF